MTYSTCQACGKPIVLINYDKARGIVGLTQAWVHTSRWVRHKPWPPETEVRS
jgi:hypothetical protein